VGHEKDRTEVLVGREVHLELHDQMHDVQGHPAASKNDHHGDQHLIGALLALKLQLFLFLCLARPDPLRQNYAHFGVAVGNGRERNDVLQDNRRQVEEPLEHRNGPQFLGAKKTLTTGGWSLRQSKAYFARCYGDHIVCRVSCAGGLLVFRVDGEWQRYRHGHHPHHADQQHAHANLHARFERVHNHKIAVDCDCQRRERAHVDAYAQRKGYQVTEKLAKDPIFGEERQRRERNGQKAPLAKNQRENQSATLS
jgi:hypothetical protein